MLLNESKKEGKHICISLKEYIWIRIVDKLIKFGVKYEAIKSVKENIFEPINNELNLQLILDSAGPIALNYPKEYSAIKEFSKIEANKEKLINGITGSYSSFEFSLIHIFDKNLEVSIMVNETGENEIHIEGIKTLGVNFDNSLSRSAHIVIPLREIVTKFYSKATGSFCLNNYEILTSKEFNLLKIIRSDGFKSLIRIDVVYQDSKIPIVISTLKKRSRVESEILNHIQKAMYKSISYVLDKVGCVEFINSRT